ncbi:N-acetyltransferase family protein [Mumia sp. DW29H23]|uniref:GNAT family N-acetyltransferase n=1 Tax=Mumia sp. DW29H23 TaxID=3421241 RepID=UPI003D681BDA
MNLRTATAADADDLTACEEAAYGTGLAHVFGDLPWPEAEIRRRWVRELGEDGVTTLVADAADGGLLGFVTYDAQVLRHLGVVPEHWGDGLADVLHDEVLARHGGRPLRLWVLEENARARRFYLRRGWHLDGRRETSEWPPFPVQVGCSRDGVTASATHSHLFRGAVVEVHVGPAVAARDLDRIGISFADGSYAEASLLEDGRRAQVLAVAAYETASGTAIPPSMWVVRGEEAGQSERRLRVGSRLGE